MTFKNFASILTILILSTSLMRAADITWTWSYLTTIPGSTTTANDVPAAYEGSGTLTTTSTPNGSGQYTVTSISGTWNVLLGPDTGSYTVLSLHNFASNDNLLSATGPQLTNGGISFEDSSGYINNINFFTAQDSYIALSENLFVVAPFTNDDAGVFAAVMVPEPSQWGLLLSVTFVGLFVWRRFSRQLCAA